MKKYLLGISCLAMPTLAAAQGEVKGVHCSCDPATVNHGPGFDCAAHCGGGSAAGAASAAGQLGMEDQLLLNLFGAFMNGAMSAARAQPERPAAQAADPAWEAQRRAAQEQAAREEAERRRLARERFQQDKAEADAKLRGPAAPGAFELKDEAPPQDEDSILKEARDLLRRAEAADAAASRALLGG